MASLADALKRLIDTLQISSASPGHINVVLQSDLSIDLDEALKQDVEQIRNDAQKETGVIKKARIPEGDDDKFRSVQKGIKDVTKKVTVFDKGNVGEIQRFTSQQIGNVRGLATNPAQFFIRSMLGKFTKGAGVLALAFVLFEVVKFIVAELLKPGRVLDRRFRDDIENRFIAFRNREESAKLFEGTTASIIVTTIGGLRGGENMVSSTFRANAGLQPRVITQSINIPPLVRSSAGLSFSTHKGSDRYNR